MPYIGNTPALDYISFAVQNFTVTAGTTVYTLDYSVSNENDIALYINSVAQRPGASFAYSATGTTLTLTSATLVTDTMYAVFIGRAVQTVVPPANINLQLADGTAAAPSLNFANDTNTGIFRPTTDSIGFAEGGTEVMRINSSGQVGIGTSPTSKVDIVEDGGAGVMRLTSYRAAAGQSEYALRFARGSVSSPTIVLDGDTIGNFTAYPYNGTNFNLQTANISALVAGTVTISSIPTAITFGTSATGTAYSSERMRIDSSGNVGIGETSVASKLHIKSDGAVNACARMNNTEAGTGSSNTVIFQRNGTNIGFITATGTATGYVTSSDYRLKENVVYNLNGIERVKLLKPARFNFIVEPNKIVDGFIAHEVSEIVPEAIHGTKDQIDSEGNPVHQGIDQSKLVPLLTGALQEAIAKIESLEARLTTLENN
jgi:hypothetical protein